MRIQLSTLLGATALAVAAPAQVNNYGLTISGGGQFAGRSCNTASCQLDAVRMTAGTTASIDVWGSPNSFFAIGVSGPGGQCRSFPGITNGVLLAPPIDTLAIGVLSNPAGPSICLALQQSGTVTAALPPAVAGLTFRLQALTVGGVGTNTSLVMTGAIDLSVL